MNIDLFLDTCVLSDRSFVGWLMEEGKGARLFVSSVVYMERRRQLLRHHRDVDDLERLIKKAGIRVVPFDKGNAITASELMSGQPKVCACCGKLDWTDAMILANTGNPPRVLVTRNVRDFIPYSDGAYIRTPDEVRQMISS